MQPVFGKQLSLGTPILMPWLVSPHLGSVPSFFVLTRYREIAQTIYRSAALAQESSRQRSKAPKGANQENNTVVISCEDSSNVGTISIARRRLIR